MSIDECRKCEKSCVFKDNSKELLLVCTADFQDYDRCKYTDCIGNYHYLVSSTLEKKLQEVKNRISF